jgi:hypothetical protein
LHFLADEKLSGYINGDALSVDGGWASDGSWETLRLRHRRSAVDQRQDLDHCDPSRRIVLENEGLFPLLCCKTRFAESDQQSRTIRQ